MHEVQSTKSELAILETAPLVDPALDKVAVEMSEDGTPQKLSVAEIPSPDQMADVAEKMSEGRVIIRAI